MQGWSSVQEQDQEQEQEQEQEQKYQIMQTMMAMAAWSLGGMPLYRYLFSYSFVSGSFFLSTPFSFFPSKS